MEYFNNLPNELLFIIFKKLDVNDLFNLRIVNKRLKDISEQSVTDLVVCDDYKYGSYWFLTKDLKPQSNCGRIVTDKLSSFRNLFTLDFSLKRLYLKISDDKFDFLEDFKQLQYLELVCKLSENKNLNLPKLDTLLVELDEANEEKLVELRFEVTKLKVLYIDIESVNQSVVVNLENVQYLRLSMVENFNLESSNSLQHLCLEDYSLELDENILTKFPNLTTLEFNNRYQSKDETDKIRRILKQHKLLNRADLIVRLDGVEIVYELQDDEQDDKQDDKQDDEQDDQLNNQLYHEMQFFDFITLKRIFFRMGYYDLLTGDMYNEKFLLSSYIDIIINYFNNQVPLSIFEKFYNVYHVVLQADEEDVYDQGQLNWFLGNLINLRKLEVNYCVLRQAFFDRLVDCKYLNNLVVCYNYNYIENPDNEEPLDCKFLTKLKELVDFYSEVKIINPFDFANKAFNQLKFFKIFSFRDKNNTVHEIKKQSSTYYLRVFQRLNVLEQDDQVEIQVFSGNNLTESDLLDIQKKLLSTII